MAFSHLQIKSKQFEAFCDIITAYISSLSFCCCSSAPSTLVPSNYLRFLKWVTPSHASKPLYMLHLLSEVNGTSAQVIPTNLSGLNSWIASTREQSSKTPTLDQVSNLVYFIFIKTLITLSYNYLFNFYVFFIKFLQKKQTSFIFVFSKPNTISAFNTIQAFIFE